MIKFRPCKLMNADNTTMQYTRWGRGVTNTKTGEGWKLCASDLFHYYEHPLLASFFDSVHGKFGESATLRTCKPQGRIVSDGTKRGAKTITTGNKIKLPVITTEQRVEIAIRVSLLLEQTEEYTTWANKWLDGTDRSHSTADAAADAAYAAAYAADAAYAAAYAADAAADAAAYAADAYAAAYAADAAAYAADAYAADDAADAYAAYAAAYAAVWVGVPSCNILDIIYQVVNKEGEDG